MSELFQDYPSGVVSSGSTRGASPILEEDEDHHYDSEGEMSEGEESGTDVLLSASPLHSWSSSVKVLIIFSFKHFLKYQ